MLGSSNAVVLNVIPGEKSEALQRELRSVFWMPKKTTYLPYHSSVCSFINYAHNAAS